MLLVDIYFLNQQYTIIIKCTQFEKSECIYFSKICFTITQFKSQINLK